MQVETTPDIINDSIKTDVKLKWLKQVCNLNQIYSSGLEYCFVNQDLEQCTIMVLCKDYLQDAVWATYHQKPIEVYGFSFDPKTNPKLRLDRTMIGIGNGSDSEFSNKILNVLNFLNQIEKKMGLKPTSATKVSNAPSRYKNGFFVLEGSKKWILSPPMLSMYTLMIRTGFCHNIGEDFNITIENVISGKVDKYQRNDQNYLTTSKPGIQKIVDVGYKTIFGKEPKLNYPDIEKYSLHNNTGICAFSNKSAKHNIPHWYDYETAKLT